MNKVSRSTYYALKPLLPRRIQIFLRSQQAALIRKKNANSWPILMGAERSPQRWKGWPDGKKFALLLTHDVESAKGQGRCRHVMKMEKSMGFRSLFNFVPERYSVSSDLRIELEQNGFEIGVHGLNHDGKLFQSRRIFKKRRKKINRYLERWNAVGFRAPAMHRNLLWIGELNIEYDLSTFDTDPFEPQADGTGTIYPFWVNDKKEGNGYVEIPYTVPQDFTVFILMQERNIDIWIKKLNWIAGAGGMVLIDSHPDYMNFDGGSNKADEYPADYYKAFLQYLKGYYCDQYWHVLPRDMARYWKNNVN